MAASLKLVGRIILTQQRNRIILPKTALFMGSYLSSSSSSFKDLPIIKANTELVEYSLIDENIYLKSIIV